MSGGGSSGPSQQTVTQSNIPEYARPYYEDIMNRGQALSGQPYQAYEGPRVAGMTDAQNTALGQAQGLANTGTLWQNQAASNMLNGATAQAAQLGNYQGLTSVAQYNPNATQMFAQPGQSQMFANPGNISMFSAPQAVQSGYTPGTFDAATAQQYMNPYQQAVTDIQKREANRQFAQQQNAQEADAASKGAFGGDRSGLVAAEMARNQGQLLNDIQAQGSNAAFQSGQQQYNQEQAAKQAAAQMGLGAQEFNSQQGMQYGQLGLGAQEFNKQQQMALGQLGLQNQQYNIGNAMQYGQLGLQNQQYNEGQRLASSQMDLQRQMANMQSYNQAAGIRNQANQQYGAFGQALGQEGQQQQQMALDRINALNQIGTQQQQNQQLGYDTAYQNFVNQRDFPLQQLSYYSSLLRGSTPSQLNSDVSTFQAPPSQLSQMAGMGIAGAGLYNAMK